MVEDWEATYGRMDMAQTLSKIRGAVEAIDYDLYNKNLEQKDVPRRLFCLIGNENFFCTDFLEPIVPPELDETCGQYRWRFT